MMLPRLLVAASAAGAAVGVYRYGHKRGFVQGLDQTAFDLAMDAVDPDRGWSDLYDVDYGAGPARDDADAAYYSLPIHDGREESGL